MTTATVAKEEGIAHVLQGRSSDAAAQTTEQVRGVSRSEVQRRTGPWPGAEAETARGPHARRLQGARGRVSGG